MSALELHRAARRADHRTIIRLLEGKADPNATDSRGRTALHVLCGGAVTNSHGAQGTAASIRVLIAAGCNPNAPDITGDAPIHTAVQYLRTACVVALAPHADLRRPSGMGLRPEDMLQDLSQWGSRDRFEACREALAKALAERLAEQRTAARLAERHHHQ